MMLGLVVVFVLVRIDDIGVGAGVGVGFGECAGEVHRYMTSQGLSLVEGGERGRGGAGRIPVSTSTRCSHYA